MPLNLWSSARYTFPLPAGHRFPIAKYERLRARVVAERLVPASFVHEPARAASEDLRRLGFPWSQELVERSYRAVGGTCEAASAALQQGIAMNLAGGTHHAFA